jgi:NADH-quinone oxidoreductase subunit G
MPDPAPTPIAQLVNLQINGIWHQFAKGTRLIEACEQAGHFVPRYCYHKKLSSPGNCRMCLIEMGMPKMGPDRKPVLGEDGHPQINWMPRPQICCATDVAEGMGVRTNSPLVEDCRRGVMEFLLINHPLDCPICDQAGECQLQEFSVEYGRQDSRFLEHKVKKPKNVELGPRVTLDDERCILCSRCIRFCKEIAHDDVLGFIDRGSYSTLTAHPGKRMENNYSLNTVDICPVGALTSTDFRFKMRVWFLKETKSICTSCATGCNTLIGSRENVIYRQTPRENDAVNSCWMCDYGRLNFDYLQSDRRLLEPVVRANNRLQPTTWKEAIERAVAELKPLTGSEIAILASGRMTNEELWLTKRIADSLGTTLLDIVPRSGEGDDILLSADRNPNTNGARLILGGDLHPRVFKREEGDSVSPGESVRGGPETTGSLLAQIKNAIVSGEIRALISLGENPLRLGITTELIERLPVYIVMDLLSNETTGFATVVLPSSGFAEKRGSMINGKGRLQRLNRAVRGPGQARDDWEILRDLLQGLTGGNGIYTIEDVFRQMSEAIPEFSGLTLSRIGDLGTQILETERSPDPPGEPATEKVREREKEKHPQ